MQRDVTVQAVRRAFRRVWYRHQVEPQGPGGQGGPREEPLDPASDGGWQSRRFSADSHRARDQADRVDLPSDLRQTKPDP
jgi:hypothetical protein